MMLLLRFTCFFILINSAYANFNFTRDRSMQIFKFEAAKEKLNQNFFNQTELPDTISLDNKDYGVTYSLNQDLNDYISKLIKRTRSDYSAVVVIDNNTGEVLSLVDYNKAKDEYGRSLAVNSTSPAASLFKVITAADLLENTNVTRDSLFSYNGRASTLYKSQLEQKNTRWTRTLSFERAFAYSNNVIFGKAALQNLEPLSLIKMADKFGFNRPILDAIDVLPSQLFTVETDYNLAELASGFNRDTLISPLHAATMATIIANDGIYKKPVLVKELVDKEHEKVVWRPEILRERVLSDSANKEMRLMMQGTVKRGTATGAFRQLPQRIASQLEIGGKTGTITGGIPFGKRDWFIAYATPHQPAEDKGISVGVMIVNLKKWHVKSTYLAKEIIQYYYNGHLQNK